jgi:hypothetical protein
MLLQSEGYSFFHSWNWAKVLFDEYKYKPLYFACIENGQFKVLIPICEVSSPLTGKRGVSLPFSDYCEVICKDQENFQEAHESILRYGNKSHWKYIEYRGGERYFHGVIPASSHFVHVLELSQNRSRILLSFSRSAKRNIKKAVKSGVEISIEQSLEGITTYYKLHCITRKHHGVPPQPFSFFLKLFEYVISRNKGAVLLSRHEDRYIAGAVIVYFGKKAVFKYAGFDRNYGNVKPNNLLLWTAIEWCKAKGFEALNLGRTEMGNTGLLAFKDRWGTRKEIVNYHRYDLRKNSYVHASEKANCLRVLFRMMPIPLLNLSGRLLYRHMG